jgi:hypothetical protein
LSETRQAFILKVRIDREGPGRELLKDDEIRNAYLGL